MNAGASSSSIQFLKYRANIPDNRLCLLEKVNLGGIDQWISVRGSSPDNPLLLFLHGGPGAAQITFAPKYLSGLEKYFTVVNWDQRGAGKSYSRKIPKESMNIAQFVADATNLAGFLLNRFDKQKLFIAAHSWGSIIGLLAASRFPHLFYSYIGIGQAVDMQDTARILCKYNYNAAKKANNRKAFKELGSICIPSQNGTPADAILHIKWLERFGGAFGKPMFKKGIKKMILFSREYNLWDKLHYKTASLFSFNSLFNELIEVNLFKEVPRISIPVYFFVGCYDYNTPFNLTEQYFKVLDAPSKKIYWFGQSGHAPHFEEPDRFTKIMASEILAEATL